MSGAGLVFGPSFRSELIVVEPAFILFSEESRVILHGSGLETILRSRVSRALVGLQCGFRA